MEIVQNKKMERPTNAGSLSPALRQALGQRVQRLLSTSRAPQRDLPVIEGNLRATCPTLDKAVREFRAAQQSTSPDPEQLKWDRLSVGLSQIRGR